MKRCSWCKTLLDENCFSKDCKTNDKLKRVCKACDSRRRSEYRKLHPEVQKKWLQKNKEYMELYREKNKEKQREYTKNYKNLSFRTNIYIKQKLVEEISNINIEKRKIYEKAIAAAEVKIQKLNLKLNKLNTKLNGL